MEMKECNTCHKVKPVEAFHFINKAKGIRNGQGADCKNAASRLTRKLHPEAVRLYNRAYWMNNPDKRDAMNAKRREAYWEDVEASRAAHNERNRKRRDKCTSMS